MGKKKQMNSGEIISRIEELTILLGATDYKALKHSEGLISEEDYAETKELRQSYRAEINELEELLNANI
jgi:hypothetical protein